MKRCRVCNGPVVIELREHNAGFCAEHFMKFCRDQVERAIDKHRMFPPDARLLVAVSGGKDSLALWDILAELGYETSGLYLGLGIGGYSDRSCQVTRSFADARGLPLEVVDLASDFGFDVPMAASATGRVPCSACGLSKRHLFDRVAVEQGVDAVVTGHNLDDEAAVLFGNVLRWEHDFLARQRPVLPGGDGFPRKAKPLIRLGERELAAYCVVRGIDYVVEECPMAEGNKHLQYKELLNELEVRSPGAKRQFYFGFLERSAELFSADDQSQRAVLGECRGCGAPTSAELCSFCRLRSKAAPDTVRASGSSMGAT